MLPKFTEKRAHTPMKNPVNLLVIALFGLTLLFLAWITPRVPDRTIVGGVLGLMICVFFPILSFLCAAIFAHITWTALAEDDYVVKEMALEPHQLQPEVSASFQTADDVLRDIYAQERAELDAKLMRDTRQGRYRRGVPLTIQKWDKRKRE